VFVRAVLGFLRSRAKMLGIVDRRGGAVIATQRFDSALRLYPHFHGTRIEKR
jgi:hypothetical protein